MNSPEIAATVIEYRRLIDHEENFASRWFDSNPIGARQATLQAIRYRARLAAFLVEWAQNSENAC